MHAESIMNLQNFDTRFEALQSPAVQSEQPQVEPAQVLPRLGSLVEITVLHRPFLERQTTKLASTGRVKVKAGRAPGRDLAGADLIGAVGTIVRLPQTPSLSQAADPLVLVRVGDEDLHLNLSELRPVEPSVVRD